jgi:transcriptional regulator with XRE-family HTH domain
MPNNTAILFPKDQRLLQGFGENLKLARLRRKLSSEQVAERAGVSRATLVKMEQGHPGVGIGHILNVLKVFNLENELLNVAKDDVLGRKLQDLGLATPKRAPKRPKF